MSSDIECLLSAGSVIVVIGCAITIAWFVDRGIKREHLAQPMCQDGIYLNYIANHDDVIAVCMTPQGLVARLAKDTKKE